MAKRKKPAPEWRPLWDVTYTKGTASEQTAVMAAFGDAENVIKEFRRYRGKDTYVKRVTKRGDDVIAEMTSA
jgi:hypothetical protein